MTPGPEKHERITQYTARYAEDYGFESVMVGARQRLLLEVLDTLRPRIVLEVGCGLDMLASRVSEARLPVEQWLIVEPGERFLEAARSLKMEQARVDVIGGFLEDSVDAIRQRCLRPPDFIICAGVLPEVADPVALLKAAKSLLHASGTVHVNVPNARSLHRRVGQAMGVIASGGELTERNRRLAQYRVFDFDTLIESTSSAGFRVVEKGGYFIKPFTHAQMQSIAGVLSEEVLDGLWRAGRELPDLASEIYVNLQAA